jgi:hypothetical protein
MAAGLFCYAVGRQMQSRERSDRVALLTQPIAGHESCAWWVEI